MRVPLTLALAFAAAGCRTQPLPFDAGASFDGATFDATAQNCNAVPAAVDFLDPDDLNLCPADLVRVNYRFRADTCQPPVVPRPLVVFDPATNGYTVTARFCDAPRCHTQPFIVERTVFLSETARPAQGMCSIRDGAPGGTAMLTIPIQGFAAPGQCGVVTQGGCTSDAECEANDPATRCWYDGTECERICFDETDCLPSAPRCTGGFCG